MDLKRKSKQCQIHVGGTLRNQIFDRLARDLPLPVLFSSTSHATAHIEKDDDPSRSEIVVGLYNRSRVTVHFDSKIIYRQVSNCVVVSIQHIDQQRGSRLLRSGLRRSQERAG